VLAAGAGAGAGAHPVATAVLGQADSHEVGCQGHTKRTARERIKAIARGSQGRCRAAMHLSRGSRGDLPAWLKPALVEATEAVLLGKHAHRDDVRSVALLSRVFASAYDDRTAPSEQGPPPVPVIEAPYETYYQATMEAHPTEDACGTMCIGLDVLRRAAALNTVIPHEPVTSVEVVVTAASVEYRAKILRSKACYRLPVSTEAAPVPVPVSTRHVRDRDRDRERDPDPDPNPDPGSGAVRRRRSRSREGPASAAGEGPTPVGPPKSHKAQERIVRSEAADDIAAILSGNPAGCIDADSWDLTSAPTWMDPADPDVAAVAASLEASAHAATASSGVHAEDVQTVAPLVVFLQRCLARTCPGRDAGGTTPSATRSAAVGVEVHRGDGTYVLSATAPEFSVGYEQLRELHRACVNWLPVVDVRLERRTAGRRMSWHLVVEAYLLQYADDIDQPCQASHITAAHAATPPFIRCARCMAAPQSRQTGGYHSAVVSPRPLPQGALATYCGDYHDGHTAPRRAAGVMRACPVHRYDAAFE